MKSWKSELDAIRDRPAMILGSADLPFTRLVAFWAGYEAGYAAYQYGRMSPEQLVPKDFHRFVTEYFGSTYPAGGKGWQTFLRENSTSEQEAFELFFRLRDEYERRQSSTTR